MKIFIPKEIHPSEMRAPVVPSTVEKLVKLGAQVEVESGLGETIRLSDEDYRKAGAEIKVNREDALSNADMILRLRKPPLDEVEKLKPGSIHISFLDPFNEADLIRAFVKSGVSAISMELIPRTTLAQKMDALSSQANLAGYVAVIVAADRLKRIFPMMMTPAGTLAPATVFVIGAGVAGLQAIATAKRLGARVEAFDTRSVVEEQVKSLGGKFLKFDLGDTGQTAQGYAKALTEEQLQKQREAMAKACSRADVVITTAQVFGRRAPVIVTTDMVEGMRAGSVVVDLAIETGGNVECARLDEEVEIGGVRVIGLSNMPARVSEHASQMYSSNLGNLIEHFWVKEEKIFRLKTADEILRGCLVTHKNEIVNETVRAALEAK